MILPMPSLTLSALTKWAPYTKDVLLGLPEGYVDHHWTNSGAEALAIICKNLATKKNREINVYLPGYFCSQSLRFLRSLPIKLHFYLLNEELLPDYSKIIDSKIDHSVDVFVHVHYFGRIAGQKSSRDFSDKIGAILIEDCAHIISPYITRSWKGDFLIFSPHKHFPVPKIGLVLARRKFIVKKDVSSKSFPSLWILKEILKKARFIMPQPEWGQIWNQQSQKLRLISCNNYTKQVASNYLANYLDSAKKRNKHTTSLLLKLSSIDGWQPLQMIEQINSPYLFGMICETPHLAKKRFISLNKQSQLAMQWPDLPSEIKEDQVLMSQCTNWVDRTLFFFNHQQLNIDSLLRKIDTSIKTTGF